MLSQARRSWEAPAQPSGKSGAVEVLSQARRSWEAGESPARGSRRASKKTEVEAVRTSGELSWIAGAVPSKLGARKHRPSSPPSPGCRPDPGGEAHWTTAFGTATDWTVPGGLDSPGKSGTPGSKAPAAGEFLDSLDIDLGCCRSALGLEPEPEPGFEPEPGPNPKPERRPNPKPERQLPHTKLARQTSTESRRKPSTEDRPARQRRPAALLPPPSPSRAVELLVEEISAAHAPVLPAAFVPTTPDHRSNTSDSESTVCHSPNQTSPPEPVRNSWTELPSQQPEPYAIATAVKMHPRMEPWALRDLIHTAASAETPASTEKNMSYGYTAVGQRLVREIFLRFDVDRDGHLSKAELRHFAMATEGEVYDDETLDDLLRSFRSGPNGLTLGGFMTLYRETELMDLARDAHQLGIQ